MNGSGLLRCISDDTRFDILDIMLNDKEVCVTDIVKKIQKDQPLVSHHLRILRECGIVVSQNKGKKVMYKITNKRLVGVISNISKASKQMPKLCCGVDTTK